MSQSTRQWSVRVGVEPPRTTPTAFPSIVVVCTGPFEGLGLTEAYPQYAIKQHRASGGRATVDHVRLPAGVALDALPGLHPRHPSLARDAVGLILAAGAPTVDVVHARAPGLSPWHCGSPTAFVLLRPVLELLTGVPVLFPDASGPARAGIREPDRELRVASLVQTVRTWSSTLVNHYQIGLVDLPVLPDEELFRVLRGVSRADFAACAFEGSGPVLQQHGWRSAAAVVGGMLASVQSPAQSLVGQTLRLPGGRPAPSRRLEQLGMTPPRRTLPEFARSGIVSVELDALGAATVTAEPTLRGAQGAWPLPLLHAVKLVHDRLVFAANLFVFREATTAQAFLLQNALRMALDEFETVGLVSGATVREPPEIFVAPDPRPDAPALVASVTAYVRPWIRKIRVNLAVRPGQVTRAEVA